MSVSKKERNKVETDSKMLANRIALLQHEDDKTIKKIEETRMKTE